MKKYKKPDKSGRLTPIKRVGPDKHYNSIWLCQCDCGKAINALLSDLKRNHVRSCGCLRKDTMLSNKCSPTHNESRPRTKEYAAWEAMKSRCAPKNKAHEYYYDRGIRICNKWADSYVNFLSDMGRAPSDKHSLDRINNDGNYEPGNVRWATSKEQASNRRKPKRMCVWTFPNRKRTHIGI